MDPLFIFFLSCVYYAFVRLFICALWSPAGKGLTSWLLCLTMSLSLYHWYPGSGVVLDCIDPDLCILTYFAIHTYGVSFLFGLVLFALAVHCHLLSVQI